MIQTQGMTYFEAPGIPQVYSNEDRAKNIIRIVCEELKIPEELLKAKIKTDNIVKARQFSCLFIRKYTTLTLLQIDKIIRDKSDHATVIHGINTLNDLCFSDKRIAGLRDKFEVLFENYEVTFR